MRYLLTWSHTILIAYGYGIMIKKVFCEKFCLIFMKSPIHNRLSYFILNAFEYIQYLYFTSQYYYVTIFFFFYDESSYKTFNVAYLEFYMYRSQMWSIVKSLCFFQRILFFSCSVQRKRRLSAIWKIRVFIICRRLLVYQMRLSVNR